jgi:hypothetical protein
MAKKGRKKSVKGQKKSLKESKDEIIRVLMAKTGEEESIILDAWEDFHNQHDNGLITKEDFLASKPVHVTILLLPIIF